MKALCLMIIVGALGGNYQTPKSKRLAEISGTYVGVYSIDRAKLRGYDPNKGSLEIQAKLSRVVHYVKNAEWIELKFLPNQRYQWRRMTADMKPWQSGRGDKAGDCFAGVWRKQNAKLELKHTEMLSDFDDKYMKLAKPRFVKVFGSQIEEAVIGKDGFVINIDPFGIAKLTFVRGSAMDGH